MTDIQFARHVSRVCKMISIGYEANIEKKVVLKVYVFLLIFHLHGPLFQNTPTHPDLHIVQIEKNVQINGRPLKIVQIYRKL